MPSGFANWKPLDCAGVKRSYRHRSGQLTVSSSFHLLCSGTCLRRQSAAVISGLLVGNYSVPGPQAGRAAPIMESLVNESQS